MNEFEVGDVVVLKSGGPKMTIMEIDGDTVHTIWFDKTIQKAGAFPKIVLGNPKSPVRLASGTVPIKTTF